MTIYCKNCGETIDPKIVDDVHVDGFADDDIICVACSKLLLRNLLDTMEKEDLAARAV